MGKQSEGNKYDILRQAKELSGPENSDEFSTVDVPRLIHDLRMHQIELEMQNEELRRVQIELEESRNKYVDLYNFAPIGYFTLDKRTLILEVNLAGAALLGVERSYLANKRFSHYIAKENQDAFYSYRKRLVETKSPQSCELKMLKNDGTLFHAELKGVAVFEASANLSQYRLAVLDITQRTRGEIILQENLAQLSKRKRYESIISSITQSVHRSLDLKEVMENAVKALSENIEDTDFVSIYMVEGEEAVLMAHKGYPDHYLKRAGRIPYQRGTTWKTIIEGRSRYVPDVDQDTAIGPAGRDIGTKSYLSTPIYSEGRAIGALNINSLNKDAFDEEELELLEIVARQIEIAINNARQAESLRVSRENYRRLFENIPVGIYRTTPDGRILMANPALVQMLGYSSFDELASQNLEDEKAIIRYSRSRFKENLEAKGEVRGLESVWTRKDGTTMHVRENARAIRAEDGTVLYYEGTVEDITEQKKAEELLNEKLIQLDKKNRYETIISSITRSVHSSINLQEVMENAVDAMFKNIDDVDNIFISLVEGKEAVLKAYRGYPTWFIEQVRKIPYSEGATWNTIIEEKSRYIEDIDLATVEDPPLRKVQAKSYLSMPICLNNETIGVINIDSFKKNAFDEEELKLLEIVARQIEIAINNAKQAEALKKSKEELELRVTERTKELAQLNENLKKEIAWHKWAEDMLSASEERYRALYDENPSMYFTINREGKILSVNQFGAERLGFSTHELIGQTMLNFIHEADRKEALNRIKYCFENQGVLVQWEFRKIHKNGDVMWVRESARAIKNADGSTVALIMSEDISDRKRIEDALRRHSEILDLANDTILIRDINDTIIYWNQGAEWLYGWTKEEAVGRNIHELLRTEFPEPFEKIRETLLRDEYWEGELLHTKRDGASITVSSRWTLQSDTEGNPSVILEINNDISERKHAEEKLRRQKELFEAILKAQSDVGECFFIVEDDRIIYANEACDLIGGYCPGDLISLHSFFDLVIPEQRAFLRDRFNSLLNNTSIERRYEISILHKSGELVNLEIAVHPLQAGNRTQLIIVGRDITERKRAEAQIKASLREKEMLLKEIHHRVKNNLQIISSLLSLQSRRIKDRQIREELKESQNRVKSMSLIHEKLYQSGDPFGVDFARYAKSLSNHLFHSYGADSSVKLKIEVDNILLSIDKAIPCGLIVHELVSNCLKHAFPDGRKGEIRIALYPDHGHEKSGDSCFCVLIIGDNGIGFPKDLDFRNSKSLGLQLVCGLARQIKGGIELDTSSGTEFRISFRA